MIKARTILIGVVLIAFDIAIYILFGLLLMNYDDFYEKSENEYWSWFSMNLSEQLTYVGLNFWHLINIVVFVYLANGIYKLIRLKRKNVL